MMTEEMNRWGGGVVHCIGCCNDTPTPAFVGRLRCCKMRVGLCQTCKPNLSDAGFKSPAHAVKIWAKTHAEHCEQTISSKADAESAKWGPKAKELYQLLGTTTNEAVLEHQLPVHATQTALVLLCRSFCTANDVPVAVFVENLLHGMERAKAAADAEGVVEAEAAKPNLDMN